MPTYTFTRTLEELRTIILRKLNYRGIGDTAGGEEAAIVDEGLNLRLKELHALGVLWFNVAPTPTDITTTPSTASVSLSAVTDFLYPLSMNLRSGTEDRPIEIISHAQYHAITTKDDTGEPEKVFVANGTAYFWPTPDAAYTVKMTYHAIAADVEAATAPDVRQEMMRCLVDIVVMDLVDDFQIPEQRAQRLVGKGMVAERRLMVLNHQKVDAATVQVDYF